MAGIGSDPGVGYYGGYLNALQTLSGVAAQQQQQQAQQFALQQAQQQAQRSDAVRAQLGQAFAVQQRQQLQGNTEQHYDQLAQSYRQAGSSVMGLDPRQGLELMQAGESLARNNARIQLDKSRAEKYQMDHLASLAFGVQDQGSLDVFAAESERAGRPLPENMRTYSPEVQSSIDAIKSQAIPASKQASLALQVRAIEARAAENKKRQEERDAKAVETARREARLQQSAEDTRRQREGRPAELRNQEAYNGEIEILSMMDSRGFFGKAEPGLQRKAVQDVHFLAGQLMRDNPQLPARDALDEARMKVLGELDREGIIGFREIVRKPADRNAPTRVVNGVTYKRLPDGNYEQVTGE